LPSHGEIESGIAAIDSDLENCEYHNGIDLEGEFDTRMGCSVQEARAVLAKIHALASD
jgi:hypothetical protein